MQPLRGVGVVSLLLTLAAHGGARAESHAPRNEAVARWAAALSSPDESTRRRALTALAALGPRARPALPAVLRALGDPSPSVRYQAGEALAGIGPAAVPALLTATADARRRDDSLRAIGVMGPAAVPPLLDALTARDVRQRRGAAAVLWRVAARPEKVRPALTRALDDRDAVVRVRAAASLLALDPDDDAPLVVLVTALAARDPAARAVALEELDDLRGRALPALPAVLRAVRVERGALRVRAAATARSIAPGRGRAFLPVSIEALAGRDEAACREACLALRHGYPFRAEPALLRAVLAVVRDGGGRRPETRCEAIAALPGVAGASRDAVAVLAETLRDKSPTVAAAAAGALAALAPGDPTVAAALRDALRHPAPSARLAVVGALARFPGEGAEVVPALAAALRDKNPPQLTAALAGLLAERGPASRAAVPALVALLADKDADVRFAAAAALVHIDRRHATRALPLVLRAYAGPDRDRERDYGAAALNCCPEGPAAVLRALRGDDVELRRGALCAALEAELLTGPVRRALPAALRDKDSDVRALAAAALVRTSRRPGDVLPPLLAGLASRSERVRRHALGAIQALGPRAAAAVPALLRLLRDDAAALLHPEIVSALERIGPAAAAAVPDLVAALADERRQAREQVLNALASIRPDNKELRRALADRLRQVGPAETGDGVLWRFAPLLREELFRSLRDGDASTRAAAVTYLQCAGDLDPRRVRAALDPMLASPDALLRLRAAEALPNFTDPPNVCRRPCSAPPATPLNAGAPGCA